MMPGRKAELSSCHLKLKEEHLRIQMATMVEFSKEENTRRKEPRAMA